MAKALVVKKYTEGEIIYAEGDVGSESYIVK